jgi:hypothetical protein
MFSLKKTRLLINLLVTSRAVQIAPDRKRQGGNDRILRDEGGVRARAGIALIN